LIRHGRVLETAVVPMTVMGGEGNASAIYANASNRNFPNVSNCFE
jgi:hypothetical protein